MACRTHTCIISTRRVAHVTESHHTHLLRSSVDNSRYTTSPSTWRGLATRGALHHSATLCNTAVFATAVETFVWRVCGVCGECVDSTHSAHTRHTRHTLHQSRRWRVTHASDTLAAHSTTCHTLTHSRHTLNE